MKWMPKESIKISMLEHFEEFKTNYPDIANVADKLEGHKSYFEDKIDGNFNWKWHAEILEKLQLHHAPKDISILDIGTQFGFVPHFLKEYGFTDVSCTNSSKEAGDGLDDLQKVWKLMNLEPIDLHIEAEKEFTLDKKYDLILMNSTNALWNNKRLCHFTNGILDSLNYVVDSEEESHTFIVPFSTSELKDFISKMQSCLTEDGIAIIQPLPFPYRVPEFEEELKLVKGYFHKMIHWNVTEENASRDYFVISGK
tara:strand:+ start:1457 stop:2218 length:762 start_codon:yes stop_codon:yes gene_type:complete